MPISRHIAFFLSAVAMMSFFGCSRIDPQAAQAVLDRISHAPEAELSGLLYGYSQLSSGAQNVLLGMLQPLRASSADQHMSVEAVHHSGRFTMIVARVPWHHGLQSGELQPIIICGETGHERVVGYVLPFDDIVRSFGSTDNASITELSRWWIENYAMPR